MRALTNVVRTQLLHKQRLIEKGHVTALRGLLPRRPPVAELQIQERDGHGDVKATDGVSAVPMCSWVIRTCPLGEQGEGCDCLGGKT